MTIKKALDAYPELLIHCVDNKIQLTKPTQKTSSVAAIPLSELYDLSMPIFFYNCENKIADCNSATAEWAAVASIRDVQNKPLKNFLEKPLVESIYKSNQKVYDRQSMEVFSLNGKRRDNLSVSAISFKFPCYYDNQFVGIFNCSLKTDVLSLPDFLNNAVKLFSTGLIDISQTHSYSFSSREREVLKQVLLGRTAKEIGERLNISTRTVECYMATLKLKTKTKNKYELIEKFKDNL